MTASPTWDDLPLRPELRHAEPYGAPHLDVPVCLNVNENPYAPPPEVQAAIVEAVAEVATRLNRYPDREAVELRRQLARYLGCGLEMDQMWAANGSNEIMIQILTAFGGPGRSVLTFSPSYSMYPEYARDTHTDYIEVARNSDYQITAISALAAIEQHRPDVVVIANPNNPTGTVTDADIIKQILAEAPGMVVVDEAYQEFSCLDSSLTQLPRHPRLIVTRTMSKAFAFAGGRLGYAAAAPAVIDALRVVRLPYHLSSVTQAVAVAALNHADLMLAQVEHLCQVRDVAIERLRGLGLTVVDTQANFFLFGPFHDRDAVWAQLVDQGVLVRATGPDHYLRACVGTDDEMELFHRAVATVVASSTKGGSPQ
ncbi:MAG: histidinol-phosphate transaminase [Propionibacteriaceae bacterium]|jgi:histidinol-phosphate aminotransferase|nr:histidinol-phosphate transaminase [Propionibacteriaceae bacterium]